MSGHSKWHNIRIKKQKVDLVRGKLFSKFAREIAVAAREGGANPEGNARLRTAIERAREAGMPNDNVQRAIQRGAGGAEGTNYETSTYEGYAPGGVAVLVEVLTDNRNRTAADVRSLFSKHGGALGEMGSVAWMFDRRGVIVVERAKVKEDDLLLVALEAGADDVRSTPEAFEIVTVPEQLFNVKQALEGTAIPLQSADVTMLPKSTVRVEAREAKQVLALMEALEDHDDVQRAYANFDIPDEILQQVS
ncbi:MAG TPA: YebC/PmpR family DNA-binding transcriptional regulator [bacterium]|nr:YebC/PmpR family DNA-binding transcriptional regulator [bacterium]